MNGLDGCLSLLRKGVVCYCPTGVGPEESPSAQPFSGLLETFQGETGVSRLWGFNPDCPQRGPYEASEEIYPGHGQQKLRVGRSGIGVDKW